MTYAEAKMRLISLPSNQQTDSALLIFNNNKGKNKKRKADDKDKKKKKDAKPWCTYCKSPLTCRPKNRPKTLVPLLLYTQMEI